MSDAGRASVPAAAAISTAEALTRFTRDVFARAGMSDAHAAIVADVLVWASLRGVDSHGIARIPMYVRLIDDGDLNLTPTITLRTETVASTLFDADRAAGPIAMTTGTRAAMRKAREAGIGMALVRATTHTAALGYYTLMAAQEGMAALAASASTPFMAYHGTRVPGVSTNPLSIAVPGGERGPVVLDMATGVVARGRLVQASKAGQPIPAGWALDRNGQPTTDPREAQTLLPLGGPKGSGLSLMIELITSVLVSNPVIAEALEETVEGGRHRQNGLVIAIDVGRYGDPLAFRSQVDRLIAALQALPRAPGVVEVLMPGERGSRTYDERSTQGIPVPPAIAEELRVVADRFSVPMFPSAR